MKQLLIVFGTRPEAIKLAPVILLLKRFRRDFNIRVCVTGQHRHLLDQVLSFYNIKSDFDFNLMRDGQDLFSVTASVLDNMRSILSQTRPDLILVQGDTTTTFAASLAGYYSLVPVAHVEAGLRTHDIYSPYPEEFNRQITSKIATYHFAPTALNKELLIKEGVREDRIYVTGNTGVDALLLGREIIQSSDSLRQTIEKKIHSSGYKISRRPIILVTGHRRESFGHGLLNICKAIRTLSKKFPEHDFVYPVHPNPNVQKPVHDILHHTANIYLISPLDYPSFIYLMDRCYLVLTDSGGIQEEAPSLSKPVLVMREKTERTEGIESGVLRLVGTRQQAIVDETQKLIQDKSVYAAMQGARNPYGDGKAGERIVAHLLNSIPAA